MDVITILVEKVEGGFMASSRDEIGEIRKCFSKTLDKAVSMVKVQTVEQLGGPCTFDVQSLS